MQQVATLSDLARRNMWPTLLGLGTGVIVTAFLA
jgi:hypothetical protein